jgi:hypothetical protein
MAHSNASTPKAYLDELPVDRARELSRVRRIVREHLPKGYRERMNFGMITYEVPITRYAGAPGGQPLCYAGLAAQKNHLSLYLMPIYGDPKAAARLKAAFQAAGKKLDMGKSCIRFMRADDLPLEAIGELVASVPVERYIAFNEKARQRRSRVSR